MPHLLGVTQGNCGLLQDVLYKYCDVLPRQLPKNVPLNRELGDMLSISL